jgi:flagellar biosynthesis/type III secretory pathway protein FliH
MQYFPCPIALNMFLKGEKIMVTEDDRERAYEKGYLHGANSGYGKGRRDGYKEGYEKAWREGYKKGWAIGYHKGYEAAHEKLLASPQSAQ